ncbi:hypothetical protein GCM10010452_25770 [Crossiella cryophila]
MRRYVGHLQAEEFVAAAEIVDCDQKQIRHVVNALWRGSVEADSLKYQEEDDLDPWDEDFSWLRELQLQEPTWNPGHGHVWVAFTYRGRKLEVELAFWFQQTDAGWILNPPGTYW